MTIATDPVKNPSDERFEVNWYGKKAFLRQSVQLHKQMLIIGGMDKIFEIGMFWRAEGKNTYRHLDEAWGLDIEIRNSTSHHQIMNYLEVMIKDVFKKLEKYDKPLFKKIKIEEPKNNGNFPRITYAEAIQLLKEKGIFIEHGEDIGVEREMK